MSLLLLNVPAWITTVTCVLTCFAILRHALSLSSGVDRNHSCSVDSIRLQVLQDSVVGAAWYLDLDRSITRHTSGCIRHHRHGLIVITKRRTCHKMCSNTLKPFSSLPSLPLLQLQGHRRSYTDAHCPQQAPTGHSGCW